MIKTFAVGMFQTNCHTISCQNTQESIIIDPGFDDQYTTQNIIDFIDKNALQIKLIINTHGHPDHTCGNNILKERFNIPILIHKNDAHLLGETGKTIAETFGFKTYSPPADKLLEDGNLIKFGKETLKVLHTPGHSRGSTSLVGENEVFTGDTLFAGSIGRTDFPESSNLQMQQSLQKLKALPDHFTVYPGHGPATTIGEEKRSNPFMQTT